MLFRSVSVHMRIGATGAAVDALYEQIPNTDGLASEEFVNDAIIGATMDMATKEEISGKLDKVEGANGIRVYAVNGSTQNTLSVGYSAGSNTVVRRNSSGRSSRLIAGRCTDKHLYRFTGSAADDSQHVQDCRREVAYSLPRIGTFTGR